METRTCCRCGETKALTDFPKTGKTRGGGGRRYDCKPCYAAAFRERERTDLHRAVTTYRRNAKAAGRAFELTEEAAAAYFNAPCAYCGTTTEGLGIDRVDSSKGYVEGNMVPCCTLCNRMKSDLPREVFLTHVERILTFARKGTTFSSGQ